MKTDQLGPGEGLDCDAALARVGGDADLLKEIARIFLDDCPRAMAEMRDASARGDCVLLERAAHGLKGAASNFGASNVVAAALNLEKMGRSGTVEGFAPAYRELDTALSKLHDELESLIAS
jgi:two-component system, sensor histidine kinase and response regulator